MMAQDVRLRIMTDESAFMYPKASRKYPRSRKYTVLAHVILVEVTCGTYIPESIESGFQEISSCSFKTSSKLQHLILMSAIQCWSPAKSTALRTSTASPDLNRTGTQGLVSRVLDREFRPLAPQARSRTAGHPLRVRLPRKSPSPPADPAPRFPLRRPERAPGLLRPSRPMALARQRAPGSPQPPPPPPETCRWQGAP